MVGSVCDDVAAAVVAGAAIQAIALDTGLCLGGVVVGESLASLGIADGEKAQFHGVHYVVG